MTRFVNGFYSRANGLKKRHYQQIPTMKMKYTTQVCSICLEDFQKDDIIKRLPCKHIMHKECGKKWLKVNKRCPICRVNLEILYEGRLAREEQARTDQKQE